MPFFVSTGSEHCALRVGDTVLGGRGDGALPLYALAIVPPSAVITVRPDGAPLVRRLSAAVVVKLDGEPLGANPRELRHGSRIDVGSCHLIVADASSAKDGPGSPAAGEDESGLLTEVVAAVPSLPSGGRLVYLSTGRALEIPAGGVVIGRDGECDLVVSGKGVSRRHATVAPTPAGFALTDRSANGTYLNGKRVATVRTLARGDVVRVGVEEFRFELEPSAPAVQPDPAGPTEIVAAVPPSGRVVAEHPRRSGAVGAARDAAAAPPLATLEVTSGALAGSRFPVGRPVCAIGRGLENDVQLAEASVSASHATLLLKRGAWFVVDLRSANGTYVDGYRVAGERALPPGGMLRIGIVTMRFRPLTGGWQSRYGTRRVVGFLRRLSRML